MAIVKEDKVQAATKVTVSKEGNRSEVVDHELRYKLVEAATKMAKNLPDLYKTRKEMIDLMGEKENIPELPTFTSSDVIIDNEEDETSNENLSTVDQYMIKHGRRN
jgi:antitoxin component of MazEF toxin-antitoxin module